MVHGIERAATQQPTVKRQGSSDADSFGAEESATYRVGTLLAGRYEVRAVLGAGGMAVVYEVTDQRTGGLRALKLLRAELLNQHQEVRRFRIEAKVAERLADDHVVRITDVDEHEGVPFFVMERLQGQSLADLVDDTGALPVARALEIARQCCRALVKAHERGIVHRDIKAPNIFIGQRDGRDFVKLLDFGISKLTRQVRKDLAGVQAASTSAGVWYGTPHYMAPEQTTGTRAVDARVDVYSVGVVLFEMLTGSVPFDGKTVMEVLREVQHAPVPSLRSLAGGRVFSKRLEALMQRALAKDPEQRFQDIEALEEAILACVREGVRRTPFWQASMRKYSRWLLYVAALGPLVWWGWHLVNAESARPNASAPEHATAPRDPRVEVPVVSEPPAMHPSVAVPAPTLETARGAVTLVYIPGGPYIMGSPSDEVGRVAERERQRVVSVAAFYLGKYEVTNREYRRFLEAHPGAPTPEFWESPRYNHVDQPVVGVAWEEAQRFATWVGGRLPTEAEWEYAARAGTQGERYGKPDAIAHYGVASGGPSPVGGKRPNAFGLYDMLGNALELTATRGISRGGSWGAAEVYVSVAARNVIGQRVRNKYTGFRVAYDLPRDPPLD